MPAAKSMTTLGGNIITIDGAARGRQWTETYAFKLSDSGSRELLAFTRRVFRDGSAYTKTHPLYLTPKGTATGSLTINGAAQTGTDIFVTGTVASENQILKAGDIVRIGSASLVFDVLADVDTNSVGGATMSLNPPILANNEPVNGSTVTMSGVQLDCRMIDPPEYPSVNAKNHGFLTVIHREAI